MIEWSDKYLVGVQRIDFEHRIFLDLIIDFEKSVIDGAGKSVLENILNEIILYARFHFRSEENMMARVGYPALAAHRDIHYQLIDVLNNKMSALSVGSIEPAEVLTFLIDWFVKHTTLEDTKIAAFMQSAP
jgi:hemerythrin